MRIILDMDEVLVDFIGGACAIWGLTKDEVLKEWEAGIWDMVPPLSRVNLQMFSNQKTITEADFWRAIHSCGNRFWVNLKATPWFDEIIKLADHYSNGNWHVVTSPSYHVSSYDGKVRWLKNRFGISFDRFAITPHKELFANHSTILIDDRESTIDKFTMKSIPGGLGILFPAHHNSNHEHRDDPIPYVQSQLEALCT